MNRRRTISFVFTLCGMFFVAHIACAQTSRTLSLSDAFSLALTNSKQLKLSQVGLSQAQSYTRVVQTAQTPSIDVSLSASYISNALITNRDFSNAQSIALPHFGNMFGIEASQVLFAGKSISTSIAKARLEEQVAQLNYARNELDVCFLVAAYYLDLYKCLNQHTVFQKNIEQTELLIQQVQSKESQGMVLRSDVTRHELLLQNLKLSLIEVDNRAAIINNQLVTTLGLPFDTGIVPDSSILHLVTTAPTQDSSLAQALANLPELKSAALHKEIAAKDMRIARADYFPQLALLAANNLNGPILIDMPAVNRNFNYWYVGIGLRYKLSSLYKNNRRVELASHAQHAAEYAEAIAIDNAQLAVRSAYIQYKESFDKLAVYETSLRLADENYRVINNRYLNDLVLITEMLDASNTKLTADLQVVNAKLALIFNYYKLQREMGTLLGSR